MNDGFEKGTRSRPSRVGVRTGSVQGVPLFARPKLSVVATQYSVITAQYRCSVPGAGVRPAERLP